MSISPSAFISLLWCVAFIMNYLILLMTQTKQQMKPTGKVVSWACFWDWMAENCSGYQTEERNRWLVPAEAEVLGHLHFVA